MWHIEKFVQLVDKYPYISSFFDLTRFKQSPGIDLQRWLFLKLAEECSELSSAICKMINDDGYPGDVRDETADVLNTLELILKNDSNCRPYYLFDRDWITYSRMIKCANKVPGSHTIPKVSEIRELIDTTSLSEYTCAYFDHDPTPSVGHIHQCTHKDNVTKRCGFNSALDSKRSCPLYWPHHYDDDDSHYSEDDNLCTV
jgi:hypothetical protein